MSCPRNIPIFSRHYYKMMFLDLAVNVRRRLLVKNLASHAVKCSRIFLKNLWLRLAWDKSTLLTIYKGMKVAIKCKGQDWRSYLMWMDLKNLKKLAELLGKFEPKSMELIEIEYQSLYEESERLLSWSNSAAKDSGLEGSIIFIERRHIAAAASSAKMEVVSGWVQHVHDVVLWLWWVLSSGLRRGRRWPQHITIYYHNWPS